ncbi:MAG: RNA-binding protein, partial [Rhodoferax sp.]|nr:RNA-binding protein [Rhodoferax sp.]
PQILQGLNRAPVIDGRAMLPSKVSINSQTGGVTGLRFAIKGSFPGQIAQMCDTAGLAILSIKRIRVGRVPLAGLLSGQWRYLMPYERF